MDKLPIVSLLTSALALVAVPATAQDWSGPYGGASVSIHNGTNTDYFQGGVYDSTNDGYDNPYGRDGNMVNVFGGFRWQNGNMVFGPELAFSSGALKMEGIPENKITDTQSVQMKVGYAMERVLVSAGVGYFKGNLDPRCVVQCGSAKISGASFSIGVDYLLTEKAFVGAALNTRSFGKATYELLGPDWEVDGDDTSVELRVGYNF